ncbi:hypothetical protein V1498_15710 [Peribacillus sp. SCS-26]|uniref:hypothetical protein n=1 Tax=Paraperibacillus marinus TaxID=3115295 RepID=UPI0039067582
MKRSLISTGLIISAFCGSPAVNADDYVENPHTAAPVSAGQTAGEIKTVTESILALLLELDKEINSGKSTANINNIGASVESAWDGIEKKVEKMNPVVYRDIESSLYPLIAEAKKETPDLKNLERHRKDTARKLADFKASLKR